MTMDGSSGTSKNRRELQFDSPSQKEQIPAHKKQGKTSSSRTAEIEGKKEPSNYLNDGGVSRENPNDPMNLVDREAEQSDLNEDGLVYNRQDSEDSGRGSSLDYSRDNSFNELSESRSDEGSDSDDSDLGESLSDSSVTEQLERQDSGIISDFTEDSTGENSYIDKQPSIPKKPAIKKQLSLPEEELTHRIKPSLRRQLSLPAIELLNEKIALGYKDKRFVEKNPVDKRINLLEQGNICRVVDDLLKTTKTLFPVLEQDIKINVDLALKSYKARNEKEDIDSFKDSLHNFSERMADRWESNKETALKNNQPWDEEKYLALINAYKVMGDLVEDHYNRSLVVECKMQLRKAFSRFENPSEESFLRARGQIGVEFDVASLDFGYELSSQLVGCDDTKIRLFRNQKGTLRASVGNKGIKGYAAGAFGQIDGKVFNNLDEFIDYYADSILLPLHSYGSSLMAKMSKNKRKSKRVPVEVDPVRKANKHRNKVMAEVPLLEKILKKLELPIMADGHLKYGFEGKAAPLEIKRAVTEGHVGGRVQNVIAIDRKATKWGNTFTKKWPLLQQLEDNPSWLIDYDSHCFDIPTPFNMTVPYEGLDSNGKEEKFKNYLKLHYPDNISDTDDYSASDIMPFMDKRLSILEDTALTMHRRGNALNRRGNALSREVKKELDYYKQLTTRLIKENYKEYKQYCEAVNTLLRKSASKKNKDEAKAFIAGSQRGCSAKCPEDMLKMMIVSHARMKHMYQRTIRAMDPSLDTVPADIWRAEEGYEGTGLEEIGLDMSVPDIPIDPKRQKYLMSFKQAEGSIDFKDTISKFALGPFEGLVDVRYIKNRDEPNPDSDGDYLYIALRGSVIGTASLAESSLRAALTKFVGTLPPVDGEAGILIDPMASVDAVLQGLKHLKVEIFLVKGEDNKYHLQYERYLTGEEFAVQGGFKAPVAEGVSVTGHAAVDGYGYHFKKEVVGENTMSYLVTRYNGLKIGNKLERWEAYTGDKKEQMRLAKLMVNMATDEKNANKEFKSTLDDIRSHYELVSDAAVTEAKLALKEPGATNEVKLRSHATLERYRQQEKLKEEERFHANAIFEKAADKGAWVERFKSLQKVYGDLKEGPVLPCSEHSDAVEKTLDHFFQAVDQLKTMSSSDEFKAYSYAKAMKVLDGYIDAEKARFDANKEIMQPASRKELEDHIDVITGIQSTLHSYIKTKKKHTPLGLVTNVAWTKPFGRIKKSLVDSLDELSEKLKPYKDCCIKIGDGGERGVLEHLIGTEEFTQALASFNELLDANHPAYLKKADSRFKGVNPNSPKPYGKA